MSGILCVWELGAGYGHLGRLLPVALQLRERGHEVVFALRDLTHAEVRRLLGLHTRLEVDALLKQAGIELDYTLEDLERERSIHHELRSQ